MQIGLVTSKGVGQWSLRELSELGVRFSNPVTYTLRTQELTVIEVVNRDWHEKRFKVFSLRTVEDIVFVLQGPSSLTAKRDLGRLVSRSLKDKILGALSFKNDSPSKRGRRGGGTGFAVFVKQDCDYQVYRRDIVSTLSGFIERSFSKWSYRDPAQVEFWGFFVDGKFFLTLRLTENSFRLRRYKSVERPGSLRPTLAATLNFIGGVKPSDFVLDPLCGVGTILIERAAWPCEGLVGGDLDQVAVELAESNVERSGVSAGIFSWDATCLDQLKGVVSEDSVNKVVTNLPFGKRFGGGKDLKALYRKFLLAWTALLPAGSELILLTSEGGALRSSVARLDSVSSQSLRRLSRIDVQGTPAEIFRLRTGS